MTEALRDVAKAGGGPPDQVDAGRPGTEVVVLIPRRPSTEPAAADPGMTAADAGFLGEYNLYNG